MTSSSGPEPLPDLYAVLGVAPDADHAQIRGGYRRRALALHPDRNPEPDAAARFRAVVEAYTVLADSHRRAAYDTARTSPCPGPDGSPTPSSPPGGPAPATHAAADYTPTGEPVAHTDYTPTTGYAPPPPPAARPTPPPGGRAQSLSEPLPAGWPTGRIDHRRMPGRLLFGVWRLAPLPAGRIAAGAVVAATLATAALAVTSREEMPLESGVIGFLAFLALTCWTVRVLTLAVLHGRRRIDERTR